MRITQEDQIALHEAAFKLESVTPAQIAGWLRAVAVHPTGRAFSLPPFPGSSSDQMIPFETMADNDDLSEEVEELMTTRSLIKEMDTIDNLCHEVERRLGVAGIFSGSSRSLLREMMDDLSWSDKIAEAFVNDVGRPPEGESVRTWKGFIYKRVKDFQKGWF